MYNCENDINTIKQKTNNRLLFAAKWVTVSLLLALYIFIPKQDVIAWIRWFSLFLMINMIIVYWDFGSRFEPEFKKSKNQFDFIILNFGLILNIIIIVTALIININILPSQILLLKKPIYIFIGFFLFIIGQAGIYITRFIFLKNAWSGTTSALNPQMVTHGPYQYLRHPIYYFCNYMYIGIVLHFCTWWIIICTFLIITLYFICGYREEKQLKLHYNINISHKPLFLIQWLWWKYKK